MRREHLLANGKYLILHESDIDTSVASNDRVSPYCIKTTSTASKCLRSR